MSEKIKHISKVEIFGLWNRFDLEWNLNDDVNVLSGINGVGKSTILGCMYSLLKEGKLSREPFGKLLENITITFNTGDRIFFDRIIVDSTIQEIDEKATNDQRYRKVVEILRKSDGVDINELKTIKAEFGVPTLEMSIEEMRKQLEIDAVTTFDAAIVQSDAVKKLSSDEVKTELDWQIYQLQKKYLDYQLNLGKRAFDAVKRNSAGGDIAKIQESKERFLTIIDELFSETGKKINRDANEIGFLVGDETLSPYQLSSGEKQLLVILLTTLIQDNKNSILFLDEPEISLHIDWQKKLIKYITELNPNAQLILATHSPAVIMDGWLDKVSEVSDLVTNKSKSGLHAA